MVDEHKSKENCQAENLAAQAKVSANQAYPLSKTALAGSDRRFAKTNIRQLLYSDDGTGPQANVRARD